VNSVVKDAKSGVRQAVQDKAQKLIDSNAMLGKSWSVISNACLNVGEIGLGVEAAKRAANVENTLVSHIQYAGILAQVGRISEALKCLETVPKEKQDFSFLHLQGVCFSQLGHIEQAKTSFNKALTIHPLSGPTWISLVALGSDSQTIERLLEVKQRIFSTDGHNVAQYLFALSKAYENNKEIKLAIEYAELAGDKLKPILEKSRYKVEFEVKQVEALVDNQNDDFFSAFPEANVKIDFTPIFIIGLPRSGTTLLSQVLAGHTEVSDGQELNLCHQALLPANLYAIESDKTKSLPIKQKQGLINHFATEYMALLKNKMPNTGSFVVDKTLDLNRYAGLLTKAFPQAKFIYLSRNKVDNAWSVYKNFFNQGFMWSYSIAEIETFFNAEAKLIKHWLPKLEKKVINVEYEEFVQAPEKHLQQLCEFIGINYQEDMLHYNAIESVVKTVSLTQVREGIKQNFIGVDSAVEQLFNEVQFD
jgi:tetratricopeptide (TPR) repeat protein